MAGFLRKKATTEKKHAGVDAKQAQLPQLPPKLPEVPPSLPPLFARFASKAPEESESPYNPWTTEISPPMLLNHMSQGPEVPQTSADEPPDVWDEWGIFEKNISTGMVMSDQTFADPRTQGTTGFSNYSSQGALPQPRQKAAIPASVPVNPRLHSFYEKPLPNGPRGILTRSPDIPSNNIHTDTSPSNGISSRSPEQKSSRPVREEIPSPPTVPSKTPNARDIETSQRSSKPPLPVHHSPISPLQTKSPKPTAPVPVLPGPTYSASSPSANHVPSSSPTAARRQLPSPAPSQDLGHTPRPPEKHSDRFPAQNTRHQAHPGSNSSHMSSTAYTSSNYTDMTGKTRSTLYSAHTSASLIAASKPIDVINHNGQSRPSSAKRPVHSHPPSSTPRSVSTNTSSNTIVGRPRSSSIAQSSDPAPPSNDPSLNRNLSTSAVPRSYRLSSNGIPAPPPGLVENLRASPARHSTVITHNPARSTSSMQVLSRTPMRSDSLYTHAPRASRSAEVGMIPPRKGPLIFAAMASINQHNDSVTIASATPSRPVEIDATSAPQAYPSPPAEVVPLDRRSTERHHRANDPSTTSGPDTRAQAQRLSPSPFEKDPQGSAPVVPFEPILPTRVRKLSKAKSLAREGSDHLVRSATSNEKSGVGSESPKVSRVLTKARPITPSSPKTSEKLLVEHDPSLTDSLLLDADPFAKAEGVQMVKSVKMSSSRSSSRDEGVMQMSSSAGSLPSTKNSDENAAAIDAPATPGHPKSPPTPVSPEEYKIARAQRRGQFLEKSLPPLVADMIAKQEFHEDEPEEMIEEEMVEEEEEVPPKPPTYFPIVPFLSDVTLLPLFLPYLSFSDWCALYSTTKEVQVIFESRLMREKVLERYLKTVGYVHWTYEWAEPLALSLKDLNNYMRGVSMPTHQYARFAESYLQPKTINQGEPPIKPDIDSLALTTRAYTRVLLRLRAQAESEARYLTRLAATQTPSTSPSRPATRNSHRQAVRSRASSRAPSPSSSYSHSYSHHGAGIRSRAPSPSEMITFRSPLFRPQRAPLLRVFVPSPEGEWLSDASVMECEAELKRSGVMKLLRVGDVVWDIAVGDEGNAGRMVWDGSYLVDLDYKFSRMGELPPYFHNLAFSPSYFHRVLRTGVSGSGGGNPIVYIDLSPWGEELATNLQLLQDRARAETPHGTLHNVVRWVHRSSFTIRPPSQLPHSHIHTRSHALRLPIPNVEGFFIDPGWYGTVIIEAEGTNEGLADLQERCGPGAFPPRAEAVSSKLRNAKEKANQRVFRILREKSRPGEIWIRTVREKERVI